MFDANMVEMGNISEYRDRLDKTLSCHDLVDKEVLERLVKNQFLNSSNFEAAVFVDKVVERRTNELAATLGMLRSASLAEGDESKLSNVSHGGWKIKQDAEDYRVMYREGAEGTPFHTLLVEGFVDGPLDVCLCISWEADLYKKWWPQTTVPSFKVSYSQCLQKVRVGEQISVVRMKLPWPLSTREALIHFFEFNYFQEDLTVVLLNSISDFKNVEYSSHGICRDGVTDADDVVRIDVVGGFAMQKVSTNRSYFRSIANMDIKLDFVPPALINFFSRQLIGSGFKLYKKEVASVSIGDEDFSKALKGLQYNRIREALYSDSKSNGDFEVQDRDKNNDSQTNVTNEHEVQCEKICGEIEENNEEDNGEARAVNKCYQKQDSPRKNQITEEVSISEIKKVGISPEVQQALATLEKAISFIRNSNTIRSTIQANIENSQGSDETKDSKFSRKESTEITASPEHRINSGNHISRHTGSISPPRETNHNKIAPVSSPSAYIANSSELHCADSHSLGDQKVAGMPLQNIIMEDNNLNSTNVNSITKEDMSGRRKSREQRYCCCTLLSIKQIST
ncbi:unnamed protein product [Cuscuta epithymum]|uniref:START domain-containing protein n=2 Tax=Cuscuta epithymum TaxID=186058 RepID=A0AAV0FHJ2_9ASTE|nr:unnamed protein product [Cuscuta epithymum]